MIKQWWYYDEKRVRKWCNYNTMIIQWWYNDEIWWNNDGMV